MLIAQKPNCRGRGKGVCCSVSAHSGGGVGWVGGGFSPVDEDNTTCTVCGCSKSSSADSGDGVWRER